LLTRRTPFVHLRDLRRAPDGIHRPSPTEMHLDQLDQGVQRGRLSKTVEKANFSDKVKLISLTSRLYVMLCCVEATYSLGSNHNSYATILVVYGR